jgi:hypothetical protein
MYVKGGEISSVSTVLTSLLGWCGFSCRSLYLGFRVSNLSMMASRPHPSAIVGSPSIKTSRAMVIYCNRLRKYAQTGKKGT